MQKISSVNSTGIVAPHFVGLSETDYMNRSSRDWHHSFCQTTDQSSAYTAHYFTRVAVTGEPAVQPPQEALLRATLLYIVQNIAIEKLPQAYSLLSDWFGDLATDSDWVRPPNLKEGLGYLAKTETRVALPTFFDD